jgi:hypothetical protein
VVTVRPNLQLSKAFISSWVSPQQRAAWQPLQLTVQVLTWSSSSSSGNTAAAAAVGSPGAYKAARKSASNAVVARSPVAAAAAAGGGGGGVEGVWQETFRFNGRIALVSTLLVVAAVVCFVAK